MARKCARSGAPSGMCPLIDNLPVGRGPSAERLVGLGFRGWTTGIQTGDLDVLGDVWSLYSEVLPLRRAEAAVGCLAAWVKAVCASASQGVTVAPQGSFGYCRDECLAISMIAASQHNTCPAMRACAFALIEAAALEEVLHHTETFAVTMRSLDQVVPAAWIVNANRFIGSYSHQLQ